jgi:hypothetical protein
VNWFAYHSQVSHRIVEHERIVWHVPSPRLKSKGISWCVRNRGFGTGPCYYHAYPSRRSNLEISWSSSTWPRNRPVDANVAVDGCRRKTRKPCVAVHVRRDPSDTYRNFDYIDPSTQGRIRNQSRERACRPVNFRISRRATTYVGLIDAGSVVVGKTKKKKISVVLLAASFLPDLWEISACTVTHADSVALGRLRPCTCFALNLSRA